MHLRLLVVITAVLGACGGGGATASIDAHVTTDAPAHVADASSDAGCATRWAVDVGSGNDTHAGDCFAPFKTITHALSVAASGDSIQVAPGTYDAATGETLPIAIPAGVTLLGDEAHRGVGATATVISGYGSVRAPLYFTTTITLGTGATIAGFKVVNNDVVNIDFTIDVWLYGENNGTLRNNTFDGGSQEGLIIENGSTGVLVQNNTITNHSIVGIIFVQGGTNSKIEGNTLTGNHTAVEFDSAGGDLGGGTAGSTGGNTISCSTATDIWTNTAAITITATNNLWDHTPPTQAAVNTTTDDIYNGQSVPLDTTGATLAAAPCP